MCSSQAERGATEKPPMRCCSSPRRICSAFTRAASRFACSTNTAHYALIQREWRPYRRVLRFCLQAPCLSQGISAAFGQKSAPCGNCSACRSGAIGKEIPNIPRMTVQELYCWILQLHRDELHRRNPHQKQATNAQLREIAETMQLPDNLPGRETYFPYLRAFQSHP